MPDPDGRVLGETCTQFVSFASGTHALIWEIIRLLAVGQSMPCLNPFYFLKSLFLYLNFSLSHSFSLHLPASLFHLPRSRSIHLHPDRSLSIKRYVPMSARVYAFLFKLTCRISINIMLTSEILCWDRQKYIVSWTDMYFILTMYHTCVCILTCW